MAEESAAFLQKNGLVAVPIGASADAGIAPVQPQYVVTPEFVTEVVEKGLKGIESWDVNQTTFRVQRLCGDRALAKEYGESAAAPPGCIETIAKSMGEVARKYPGILQWAPELAIVSGLGAWFLKRNQASAKLDELEARQRKQLEQASATRRETPPPIAATPPASANAKP